MKTQISIIFVSLLLFLGCQSISKQSVRKTAYESVNPFIGTGGHGHTYPGATLPFAMVQLSPDTRLEGWDGCSGYHYSDSIIYGFSHTHLSGTGVSDYGDVLIMPIQGDIVFENGYSEGVNKGYASLFKKESEKASPGYYEVHLDKNDIDVRLTSTNRVGIHEYTFNQEGSANIILDLEHRDMLLQKSVVIVNDNEVEGSRVSKAWAAEQHIYFVMKFSKAFDSRVLDSSKAKAAFTFDLNKNEKLLVKVGISAVSIEGARKNLNSEADHWDFEEYRKNAKMVWERALKKIEIEEADQDMKAIFYTSLYHSMIAPNIFSDVDGKYRGMDQNIHQSENGPVYTVFSLWDTFRATHPLYTIIEQEKTNEFINTFLNQYEAGGELPIWELAANYTGCMIGYHSIPVIVDAYVKGIRGFDEKLALEAMVNSANQDKLGLGAYKDQGCIAAGDEAESVSKTLEYSYDDWCIAEMAKQMKEDAIYNDFIKRAQFYKNSYNPEVGFMQSKMNGGWSSGFDPAEVNFNFTEANSWQYSLFAPQDISGLITLYGGKDAFEKQLDQLFTTEVGLSGRQQSDITGLIGQYAHGNEPSHHMAYLYNYIGKAHKTQKRVNQILTEQYQNAPDGLAGNEDCGQMSAWYILSSMGFYSVTPGLDYYAIGKPHFSKTKINLENGNQFIIQANSLNDKNIYIQSAELNGEDYDRSFLMYQDVMRGGTLVFEMGPQPSKEWAEEGSPISMISEEYKLTPNPYFSTASQTFTDSIVIEIKSVDTECDIFYSIDDSEYFKYEEAITITESSKLTTYAIRNRNKSFDVSSSYKKIKGGRSIALKNEYSNQYSAGGQNGLIDFLEGSSNFRTGYWQGYYGVDFEAIVDLGRIEKVKIISLGALQDIKSWIWFPKNVKILVSSDDMIYKELISIENDFPDNEYGAFTKEFSIDLPKAMEIRYVKIVAENYGVCPNWHLGNGNSTWLFFDEIMVE